MCDFCGEEVEKIVESARCAFCKRAGCDIHFAFRIKVEKLHNYQEESKEILICRDCAQNCAQG